MTVCSARSNACALPTWWFWRGGCTRSHSEHGRETPQRRWYFVLRRGRVGRCQVCKTQENTSSLINKARTIQTGRRTSHCPIAKPSRYKQDFASQNSRDFASQNSDNAGWSSPVARQAHNLKAAGSNPAPATKNTDTPERSVPGVFFFAAFPTTWRSSRFRIASGKQTASGDAGHRRTPFRRPCRTGSAG